MFAGTKKRIAKNAPAFFDELGVDASDPEVGRLITSATSDTELLRVSAPLFSTLFLVDLLDRVLDPKLPQLANSDGEAIEFIVLVYRLKSGVTQERIRAALDQAPDLDAASPTFWNWLAPKDAGPKQKPAAKGQSARLHRRPWVTARSSSGPSSSRPRPWSCTSTRKAVPSAGAP